MWSDNALVKTLLNFHCPEILEVGMGVLQKKRDNKGKWKRMKMEVLCPAQMWDYCATFHLNKKGNGAEAIYDLGGKSDLHNWLPKLIFWLYNMALNNAYKNVPGACQAAQARAEISGHGRRREGIDT
jgi:hypothetical protein